MSGMAGRQSEPRLKADHWINQLANDLALTVNAPRGWVKRAEMGASKRTDALITDDLSTRHWENRRLRKDVEIRRYQPRYCLFAAQRDGDHCFIAVVSVQLKLKSSHTLSRAAPNETNHKRPAHVAVLAPTTGPAQKAYLVRFLRFLRSL